MQKMFGLVLALLVVITGVSAQDIAPTIPTVGSVLTENGLLVLVVNEGELKTVFCEDAVVYNVDDVLADINEILASKGLQFNSGEVKKIEIRPNVHKPDTIHIVIHSHKYDKVYEIKYIKSPAINKGVGGSHIYK